MKPAEAHENGWDVLAAILLALALGRLGLEKVVQPTPFLVYGFLIFLMAPAPRRVPRPLKNVINVLVLLLVLFYGGLTRGTSEIFITKGWVWAAAVCAFLVALRNWKGFLDGPQGQQPFPRYLHVLFLVPATFVGIIIYGVALALPVGPLSDEGMILYMEGGCDWGGSNIFFFAKLGLLIAINVGMSLALRARVTRLKVFAPHFLVALGLTALWWNDVSCDRYYTYPQGNLAQMVVESSALALLLITFIPKLIDASGRRRLITVVLLNLWAALAFHLGLVVFPHWTWMHTLTTALLTLLPSQAAVHFKAEFDHRYLN